MTAPKPDASWDDLDDTSMIPTGKTARQLAPDQYARTDVAAGVSLGRRASTIENRNQVAQFKCDKCRGSGRWSPSPMSSFVGPCRKCKGVGKLKTDPETLAKRKQAKLKKAEADRGTYIAAHIPEYTWAVCNMQKFDFARSMVEAIKLQHHWTDGQLAAIRRCMARDEERAQARAAVEAAAPVVAGEGFARMLATFARAKQSGLKWPKLRIDPYVFALAGERSKYAGKALFVKHDNDGYLGRIDLDGRWFPGDAGKGHDDEVRRICKDPLAAAVLHGKQTGHCACCGLELTNEESVRLGIGPICRAKWGM